MDQCYRQKFSLGRSWTFSKSSKQFCGKSSETPYTRLSYKGWGRGLVIRTLLSVQTKDVRITNHAGWVSLSVHVPITRS